MTNVMIVMKSITEIEVFVAGATELRHLKQICKGIAGIINSHPRNTIQFNVKDQDDINHAGAKQDAIEEYIRNEADATIVIVDEVIGEYTEREFNISKEKSNNNPLFFYKLYIKNVTANETWLLKNNVVRHWYDIFIDDESFREKVSKFLYGIIEQYDKIQITHNVSEKLPLRLLFSVFLKKRMNKQKKEQL